MSFSHLSSTTLTVLTSISATTALLYCAFFLLLASCGASLCSLLDATGGLVGKKNLINKFAAQESQNSFALFLLHALPLAVLALLFANPQNPSVLYSPLLHEFFSLPAVLFLALILTCIARTKLPNSLLSYLFTLLTGLLFLIQIFWWTLQGTPLAMPPSSIIDCTAVITLIQSLLSTSALHLDVIVMFVYFILVSFTVGSMSVMVWLIMRRNKDDYGRDYYTFAMRRSARRSLFFLLLATAAACYSNFLIYATHKEVFFNAFALLLAVAVLLLIVVCVMLLVIGTTVTPMRCKPAAIASFFVYAAVFMLQLLFLSFAPLVL